MQVRYVPDARKRAVELKKLLGRDEGFNFGVCKRFEELGSEPDVPLDVLLIDVSRANRITLEDDIRTARKYTDAPIIFVTGGENGQIRTRALEAGAEAVWPRDEITSSLIREVAKQAATRRRASAKPKGGSKTTLPRPRELPGRAERCAAGLARLCGARPGAARSPRRGGYRGKAPSARRRSAHDPRLRPPARRPRGAVVLRVRRRRASCGPGRRSGGRRGGRGRGPAGRGAGAGEIPRRGRAGGCASGPRGDRHWPVAQLRGGEPAPHRLARRGRRDVPSRHGRRAARSTTPALSFRPKARKPSSTMRQARFAAARRC